MKSKITLISISLLFTTLAIPQPSSEDTEYNYENYLTSLDILKCDDTVITGEPGAIIIKIEARTEVDLYIDFKGKYSWGHNVFSSKKVTIEPGVNVAKEEFSIPKKALDNPALNYYVYVFATLPGDNWTPKASGLTSDIEVVLPEPDKKAQLSINGPGFGYYWVDDVKWFGVVWIHYDEAGSPSDRQGIWEIGIEGLPELWYVMCVVDHAEVKDQILVAEGTFLDEPLRGLSFTYYADLRLSRWKLEGWGFYFTGFIETHDS